MKIWRMPIACCITNAANTQAEYVILISFQLVQRLNESASVLRHTYLACLVQLLLYRIAQ